MFRFRIFEFSLARSRVFVVIDDVPSPPQECSVNTNMAINTPTSPHPLGQSATLAFNNNISCGCGRAQHFPPPPTTHLSLSLSLQPSSSSRLNFNAKHHQPPPPPDPPRSRARLSWKTPPLQPGLGSKSEQPCSLSLSPLLSSSLSRSLCARPTWPSGPERHSPSHLLT